MIAQGMLFPLNVLRENNSYIFSDREILLIKKPESAFVQIKASKENNSINCKVESNCIFLLDRIRIDIISGTLIYHKVRIDMLSKLLAFVDEAQNVEIKKKHDSYFEHLDTLDFDVFYNCLAAKTWFLSAYFENKEWIIPLCDFLRKTEHYGLVRYLLSHSISQNKLYDLGKEYGVSYSHFRRLCSSALGGKVKVELSNWRMARAVLEVIEGKSDMTSVAYKYGYSSSSHFSADVKSRLGKTPREFCKRCDGDI